jgi:hypothetical protein
MRRNAIVLALISIFLIFSAVAHAETVVVDFDDLPGGYPPIPAGYGGIADWTDWATFDVPDPNYPPHSGLVRALSFGNGVPIHFGQEYVFDGSWIAGPESPDWVVWYELYVQGVLVHTSVGLAVTPTPTWNPSEYAFPVDEVRITHTFSNFFCMDDFTYTTTEVSSEDMTWGNVKSLYR